MAFDCNIDAKGAAFRTLGGLVFTGVSAYLLFSWLHEGAAYPVWAYAVTLVGILAGLFMLFEGAMKWCAVKALMSRLRRGR